MTIERVNAWRHLLEAIEELLEWDTPMVVTRLPIRMRSDLEQLHIAFRKIEDGGAQ